MAMKIQETCSVNPRHRMSFVEARAHRGRCMHCGAKILRYKKFEAMGSYNFSGVSTPNRSVIVGSVVRCLKPQFFRGGGHHARNSILEVEENTLPYFQSLTNGKDYELVK